MSSVKSSRYLALVFPFLPTDRLRRGSGLSPDAATLPLVLTHKVKGALRLSAVDRRAAELGLNAGLTLADARARVPAILALDSDPAADAALLKQIADFCDRYTPLVALNGGDGCGGDGRGGDGLVLDITGCAHLWQGETAMRADLLGRLAKAGLEARASIAGTPHAARALARFGTAERVEPGGEPQAVAPLPVDALDIDGQTATALKRAGLKTIGALATRPAAALAARFGAGLISALHRTLAHEDTRITPRRPLPACMAERRFGEPIGHQADVLLALESLAAQTATALAARGHGGRRFEASLYRVDGRVFRLQVETARPLREPGTLIRLLRERLDSLADPLDPGFGFDCVRLAVIASQTLAPVQAGLDGRAIEEEEVAALVDRLATRFGAEALTGFAAADTHMPEAAIRRVCPLSAAAESWAACLPAGAPPARPLFLFERPQPITTTAVVPDGPPRQFRWRRVLHEVTHAEGPERIAPEWWRDGGENATRDYYRVEDSLGRRFWVFRQGLYEEDGALPDWYLHGVFA